MSDFQWVIVAVVAFGVIGFLCMVGVGCCKAAASGDRE